MQKVKSSKRSGVALWNDERDKAHAGQFKHCFERCNWKNKYARNKVKDYRKSWCGCPSEWFLKVISRESCYWNGSTYTAWTEWLATLTP